ncbi:hypothetical protein HF576_10750 [Microbacterium sp. CFH 90308]|uniref:Uncharacterized protein n=1 Tax=Microbacterium salsuginis TaxID=2722803 RepID=A0ABX1KBC8_9MICO|nr:hypothetical protein [Microbacterium sp. CFH 90308]NLP84331.1 hypothetical protein [Microbacterium sp. CFH 90308]
MDWGVLIVVGAVWVVVAVAVGLLVGRIVRRRDQEEPLPASEDDVDDDTDQRNLRSIA